MSLQSPDVILWRDLKIAVQRRSPSNLIEFERICREKMWETLQKQVCQSCSYIPNKTCGCNHSHRFFNKVLSKGSKYVCKCDISIFFKWIFKKNTF
jgi:hypothetical protein